MAQKFVSSRIFRATLAGSVITFVGFTACVPRGYVDKGLFAQPTQCPKGMAAKGRECFCMPGYTRLPVGGKCPEPAAPSTDAHPKAE